MIWLEMSREEKHGGGEWSFQKCIWAPSHKKGTNNKWLFWENILNVRKNDIVIHLRGKGEEAAFIGFSNVISDGYETKDRPPHAGVWEYAESFYRADLSDFTKFEFPRKLKDFFFNHQNDLISYLKNKKERPLNCFFVYQAGRLQCLNGAYLSKIDSVLFSLIIESKIPPKDKEVSIENVLVNEKLREVVQRRGQEKFSLKVKENYNWHCCFPGCDINDKNFLVGAHIDRWADNVEKRGNISNGLCLCCIHDRAFELGYFSIDDEYKVILNKGKDINNSLLFQKSVKPFKNQMIKLGNILPDIKSLQAHRLRNGIFGGY